jgi:hypothetical protein
MFVAGFSPTKDAVAGGTTALKTVFLPTAADVGTRYIRH